MKLVALLALIGPIFPAPVGSHDLPPSPLEHALVFPTPPPPAPPRVRKPPPWDALAGCESGGDWHLDGRYDGGLQFDPATWLAFGGAEFGRHAYDATREQQIIVAERVLRELGWGQWPVCSRHLGLRR